MYQIRDHNENSLVVLRGCGDTLSKNRLSLIVQNSDLGLGTTKIDTQVQVRLPAYPVILSLHNLRIFLS